ncbi:arginase [Microscilla marina]|uniref:Arginase n=1 Tax=Microscilla marina ATCC 23134 TaxID=313606 RepID=A1ZZD9_MICM2|nr:arginase [Microscilla marina]EAY24238.1 arginase [Microscilla marina ATCC 23134]
MVSKIKVIEVKSEIAAGTRGASLGIDALKTACLNKASKNNTPVSKTFFATYNQCLTVPTVNEILFQDNKYPFAKHIDGLLKVQTATCQAVNDTLKQGLFPLVLAGDHGSAAGTIAGVKQAYPNKRLGVIWIDAHADLHSPYTTPSGNMHGMPLAIALNENNEAHRINTLDAATNEYWEQLKNVGIKGAKLKGEDIVLIAGRDIEAQEQALMDKYGMRNFTAEEVHTQGAEAIAKQTLDILSDCDMVYVSFDVDSMDSAISAGTGTPVPNGLTVAEARDLNVAFARSSKTICWEMVEINPTLDDKVNLMAENAFSILEATTEALVSHHRLVEVS